MAGSGSRSSLGGLRRLGPRQMARLLEVILLVEALRPICWSSESSCLRRRRLAAGNFWATLREQEHRKVNKADVAHSHPRSLPKAGGSQRVCCAALQVLSGSGQRPCASGRKHGVASRLLISPQPTQGKALCPCPFPQHLSPPHQQRAARKTQLFRETVPFQGSRKPLERLLNRQAAGHTYAFSSSSFACLLVLCMARIQSS